MSSQRHQTREGLPDGTHLEKYKHPNLKGWIAQWDPNYEKWFYVNENSKDKTPQWEHPRGLFFDFRSDRNRK
jgi:WW domain